jgi:multiple RNA-binding domain-containing protein 1
MRLYVRNLSYDCSDEDLRLLFEKYGAVSHADIIVDKDTGQSKGFAFVSFLLDRDAETAMKMLNDAFHMGRKIHVEPARERPSRAITCDHSEG